jgi:hypothetical protein
VAETRHLEDRRCDIHHSCEVINYLASLELRESHHAGDSYATFGRVGFVKTGEGGGGLGLAGLILDERVGGTNVFEAVVVVFV